MLILLNIKINSEHYKRNYLGLSENLSIISNSKKHIKDLILNIEKLYGFKDEEIMKIIYDIAERSSSNIKNF